MKAGCDSLGAIDQRLREQHNRNDQHSEKQDGKKDGRQAASPAE